MVNIVNPIFDIPNQNQILSNDIAIGMPRVPTANLNYPVNPINNTNVFDPKYHGSKRYNPKGAPSHGSSTEAFFKSRNLFEPFFIHNEASTKYEMISKISKNSEEIRNNIIRFV
tara:strand:- start:708 stop:1049 length:342 start_codon:yes stop_codon:yes gene_type:complete